MRQLTLDPDLLQAFVTVADHRSFTRAAAALNRTQSAVSMQVKRLEEQLQAELFHRTKANVDLSAAGERLLGYARRILSLNEEAVGRVREHRLEGRVRLGVMDDYGTACPATAGELRRELSVDPHRNGDRVDVLDG
jgi:DNA-binding transcriptional LysR family regulator